MPRLGIPMQVRFSPRGQTFHHILSFRELFCSFKRWVSEIITRFDFVIAEPSDQQFHGFFD